MNLEPRAEIDVADLPKSTQRKLREVNRLERRLDVLYAIGDLDQAEEVEEALEILELHLESELYEIVSEWWDEDREEEHENSGGPEEMMRDMARAYNDHIHGYSTQEEFLDVLRHITWSRPSDVTDDDLLAAAQDSYETLFRLRKHKRRRIVSGYRRG